MLSVSGGIVRDDLAEKAYPVLSRALELQDRLGRGERPALGEDQRGKARYRDPCPTARGALTTFSTVARSWSRRKGL